MRELPVRLRAQATLDVEAAIDHYLMEGGPTVAAGFVDAVEEAFTHLARHPGTGSPRYADALGLPGLRYWSVTTYPYLVFYLERADHLDVWRVLHMRRDVPQRFLGASEAP